jgi:hypothetical protein
MEKSQEPKYNALPTPGGACVLVNRSTGVAIPDDEPVMVFRAKDAKALAALEAYHTACTNEAHRAVIRSRILDFQHFATQHPERMKEPDSNAEEFGAANLAPRE